MSPPATPPAIPPADTTQGTGAVAAGPATTVQQQELNRDRHMGISMASIEEIQVNQYQPRREFAENAIDELAQSIRANGIIQPLVVRKTGQGYQLIAGERRLRAAKAAGLKQVPIVIRRSTDREALELALVENIQRENLNCIEEALAYFQLIQDFSLTQDEVAQRVGKDRATVSNHLRLLRLPEIIIEDLKQGVLTLGHGKALLGVEDTELRLKARNEIIDKRLSVRDTEVLVENLKKSIENVRNDGKPLPSAKRSAVAERLANLCQELTRQWSTRIDIKGSERRGKIVIHYAGRQDLDRIVEALQNK